MEEPTTTTTFEMYTLGETWEYPVPEKTYPQGYIFPEMEK
jgi:hypothetical protein